MSITDVFAGNETCVTGDAPGCAAAVATGRTPVSEICSVTCPGDWDAGLRHDHADGDCS